MKILTVLGARPQFIKAAVVGRTIAELNMRKPKPVITEVLVHTGQHYDANMSAVFFEELHIPRPDYFLGIGGGSHGIMTGHMLGKIEEVIIQEKPDAVLVYGDTNSTLAGALAAVKLHIPIAHVEAGLRSFNMRMPEEINRVLTDRVSTWLFCPTRTAIKNLKKEGIRIEKNGRKPALVLTGDVMYDATLFYRRIARPSPPIAKMVAGLPAGFYLATVHRAENTDDPARLSRLIRALDTISRNIPVVFPLHPRTRKALSTAGIKTAHIIVTEPVGYFDMITLLSHCRGVFTDSGGLQKEAYFFGKPCIILRQETEWTELVENGYNILAGTDLENIVAAEKLIKKNPPKITKKLYGNGHAGEKIVQSLIES